MSHPHARTDPSPRGFDWVGFCARCTARLLGPLRPPGPSARPSKEARPRTVKQIDGAEGEAIARRFLERHGLTFVIANMRYAVGELDLVMSQPASGSVPFTLVFVEVRRRASDSHGGALESVTPLKRRRLVAAAARYLASLGLRTTPCCRFDLVTLTGHGRAGLEIAWHRDAFRADD